MQQWISVYLADAKDRIQSYLNGVTLTLEDIFAMQTMCAYEASPFITCVLLVFCAAMSNERRC